MDTIKVVLEVKVNKLANIDTFDQKQYAGKVNRPLGRRYSVALSALVIFVIVNLLLTPYCVRKIDVLTKLDVLSSHYEIMKKGPWSWWLSRAFFLMQPVDIVLMGDSQVNAAVFQADAIGDKRELDCAVDREALTLEHLLELCGSRKSKVVNLAMGGAMISDQYLICQALLARHVPKLVIIGISPRCFLDNALSAASATEPFHFFTPYVDLGPLAHFAFSDPCSEISWHLRNFVPLLKVHEQICQYLSKLDDFRRYSKVSLRVNGAGDKPEESAKLMQAIYASSDNIGLGQFKIGTTPIQGFSDNTKEYQHRYKNADVPLYATQRQFFEAYLSSLKNLGIKTIVVNMPCLKTNQVLLPEKFWFDYRHRTAKQCAEHGATWVDLSDNTDFTKNHFFDNVHVNPLGAKLLMDKITMSILNDPAAVQSLKMTPSWKGRTGEGGTDAKMP